VQARRYPEATAQFQKTLDRDPNFVPVHFKISEFYAMTGRFADAVIELRKVFAKPIPVSEDAKGYLQLMMTLEDSDRSAAVALAATLAGDRELAFQSLEKAYDDGDNELLISIRYPGLDPLRSDPRYADLMRRLGLPK